MLLPGGAGAQDEPTFTITPTSLAVGESATVTATGCVAPDVPQDQLFVVIAVDGVTDQVGALPTNADGTATTTVTPEAEDAGSTATFGAACVQGEGQTATVIFEYPNTVAVTVAAANTTTTSAPPTPTLAPRPAPPAAASPSFTG